MIQGRKKRKRILEDVEIFCQAQKKAKKKNTTFTKGRKNILVDLDRIEICSE
jgi:hypothetical protein